MEVSTSRCSAHVHIVGVSAVLLTIMNIKAALQLKSPDCGRGKKFLEYCFFCLKVFHQVFKFWYELVEIEYLLEQKSVIIDTVLCLPKYCSVVLMMSALFWWCSFLTLWSFPLQDGSTMLIEAAKGGHTSVVCYLLDYPNNLLSAPPPDATQLTPPSHDLNRVRFQGWWSAWLFCTFLLGSLKVREESVTSCHKL